MRVPMLAVLLLAATPIAAGAQDSPPPIEVRYGDLPLATDAGGAELARRVRRSAGDFCARYAEHVTPHHRRGNRSFCILTVRAQLLAALPHEARRAYARGAGTRNTVRLVAARP